MDLSIPDVHTAALEERGYEYSYEYGRQQAEGDHARAGTNMKTIIGGNCLYIACSLSSDWSDIKWWVGLN